MNIVTEIKRYFRPLTIHPWNAAWRLRDHGFRVALSAWVIDIIEIGDHGRGCDGLNFVDVRHTTVLPKEMPSPMDWQ